MVGGNRRLECGKDKDLTLRADLEDGPAAVSDVKISRRIESEACRDAHPLHEDAHAAAGRRPVNDAIEPARNIEHAFTIESQSGRVHQVRDERLHIEVEIDLIDGDRHLLSTRSAYRAEDISERVDSGIGDRMKVFRDHDANVAGVGSRCVLAVFNY